MKNCKNNPVSCSLMQALGVVGYVMLVAIIMYHADRLFGQMKSFLAPVTFLMLYVVSAAICGWLVFGKPVMLYWDGMKKEALKLLFMTIIWMGLFTLIMLLVLSMR